MMFIEQEEIDSAHKRPPLVVDYGRHAFLKPYFEREFDRDTDTAALTREFIGDYDLRPVMLSTTDVYGVKEGTAVAETTPVTDSPFLQAEKAFLELCRQSSLAPVIFRLPPFVIGTGMKGLPMTLARGVARGTMLKIKDNDAEVSAVHAVDVARVAKILASVAGTEPVIVNLAGDPVKINDLVEALGVRIKDKRVASIKPFWAKALYGGTLYRELTTSLTFDNSAVRGLLPSDFAFINPADYLKAHVYDHESL